jgi:hypothetical protein
MAAASTEAEPSLDVAWQHVWPYVAGGAAPVIAGPKRRGSGGVPDRQEPRRHSSPGAGLSAARPKKPTRIAGNGLPTLIVQGADDPLGQPGQFPQLSPGFEMVEVPFADHTFALPAASGISAAQPSRPSPTLSFAGSTTC